MHHGTHDIPTCIMISPVLSIPSVLKISPNGTHDIPHIYHDIFNGTEHPQGTQDILHMHNDIPHGTEHPGHGTEHTYKVKMVFWDTKKPYILQNKQNSNLRNKKKL